MKKLKLFSLLAALTCATTMWAASGTWTNDNCTATLTEDGTMTFSGTGAIERKDGVGWDSYLDDLKSLIIEDGLTSIVSRYPGAFHSSLILNSLDLGNGMQSIGNNAFNNCRALISVTIPASVTYIGNDVFYECKGITDVYCYPDAADLTWEEADKDDFKNDAATLCHVKASQLSAYISKFSSSVNVTFVGDLPEGGSSSTPAVNGKLTGEFSINSTGGKVNFSSGNLQYLASTDTWRFAEHQYDFIGDAAGNNTESDRNTQSDWIDLFGWATSGNSASGTAYQPWQSSTTDSEYGPAITSGQWTYANSDWGINPISNGGNVANSWRTLTQEEWDYILNERETGYRFCYAKLSIGDGLGYGLIILPDDWDPSYYALSAGSMNQGNHSYDSNVISEEDWTNSLEAHGAVFLPVTGMRYNGNEVIGLDDDKIGLYWSSIAAELHEDIEDSEEDPMIIDIVNAAYNLAFNGGYYIRANQVTTRSRGLAVRLVSETAPGGGSTPDPTPSTPETSDDASGIETAMEALVDAGGTTDLIINRTLYKDGFFNTLCLPFSLNEAELAASPLAGCLLYSLSDAYYDGDNLFLTIAEESTIEAGMPYLIKWLYGTNITSMTFNDVTVTASTGSTVTKGDVQFVGTIGRSTLPHGDADYLFLGANDNLFYSDDDDDTSMKGFRAYFIVNNASGVVPRHAPARLVIAPKVPTAFEDVSAEIGESEKRMENGILYIIKDGVKYNAQGQIIK